MLNSLRSRLWLTYALLIGLVLCVVGAGIVMVVFRANIPLQQAATNLQTLRQYALPRLRAAGELSPETLQTMLVDNTGQLRGRIVVLTRSGRIVADSFGESGANLPDFSEGPIRTEIGALPEFYRDNENRGWYYIIDNINEERMAYFSVYRTRVPIISVFRDQYLGPLLRAGLMALLAAFLLSMLMSRWISAPLKRISLEARQLADGQAHPIPLEGPEEVRQLASSFNDMARQVQESRQSQKDFVANVSHELKTPLTSIQGFARAIQDGTVQSEQELTEAAEVIETEAARMHRLVQDLLILAKMDAGTATFEMRPLDVNALLEMARRKFTPQVELAGIKFQVQASREPVIIQGDADSLMQVLDNLLDNALKFTPEGGQVTLACETTPTEAQIHVTDTGQGVPPEEQERIFERFYQVDKARPGGNVRGYGLGLAISRQIAEAHGGTLSLFSKIGEGSHFVVKIPLHK